MLKVKSWIKNFERCQCGAILYINNAKVTLVKKLYILNCSACDKKYHIYYKKRDLLGNDFEFDYSKEY